MILHVWHGGLKRFVDSFHISLTTLQGLWGWLDRVVFGFNMPAYMKLHEAFKRCRNLQFTLSHMDDLTHKSCCMSSICFCSMNYGKKFLLLFSEVFTVVLQLFTHVFWIFGSFSQNPKHKMQILSRCKHCIQNSFISFQKITHIYNIIWLDISTDQQQTDVLNTKKIDIHQ